jgi:acetyltransferase-like isoleucine patch superfamily enzyme
MLAIVVPADATKIIRSDIAGRPAGDYLFDELAKLDGVDVVVLANGVRPTGAKDGDTHDLLRFPVTAADARNLVEREVLLVDARAWLSHGLLTNMLSRAREGGEGLRLMDSGVAWTERTKTLAVYFPRGLMRPGVLERPQTTIHRGLEYVLNAEALARTVPVTALELEAAAPAVLIDSYVGLSRVEQQVLLDRANSAMEKGVRIRDPHHVWIRGDLVCGSDVELETNVIVEGDVVLGNGVTIGANCVLRNSRIGDNTRINPFSLVEHAKIGADSIIGPYGRIRPASSIGDGVQIGNYVEIKNSEVGSRSRINHHAFIGDATIAEDVTVGAGTITCNHDGVRINRTIVERGAYIGSGCNLVAPVRIGEGATVGAGSTITRDVPAAKLTLARSRQTTITNWRGPKRS